MQKGIFYELDGLYVRILALAVDPAYQRQSIGLRLMQEAEIWAKEIKASRLILNCGNRNERMNAHLFYAAIGFTASSTGYTKTL